jgi:isocitrate/isopropylmalate dehydrogenase
MTTTHHIKVLRGDGIDKEVVPAGSAEVHFSARAVTLNASLAIKILA